MQDLRLPEPARSVWLKTRDLIKEALERVEPSVEYRLGGGTILSARWNHHRSSFDVDIQLERTTRLEALTKPEYGWFRKELEARGATTQYSQRANLFNIRFGSPPNEREVQLWGHDLLIPEGYGRQKVEGQEETVLATAEILRGKIERAHRKLGRDAYDIHKAVQHDPESLEIAVNTIPHHAINDKALDWILKHGRISLNARERLRGIPDEERENLYNLGKDGARALIDSRYRRFELIVERSTIIVEATTEGNQKRRMTMTAENAKEKFNVLGISQHLGSKGPGSDAIREHAIRVCGEKAERTVILREEHDELIAWKAGAADERTDIASRTPRAGDAPYPRAAPPRASESRTDAGDERGNRSDEDPNGSSYDR